MMHKNESDYQFWTWIVALLLSIILLIMLFTGHGPNTTCCSTVEETSNASNTVIDTMTTAATSEFGFSASATDFSHTGDGSQLSWFNNASALKTLLASGNGLQADGNGKRVTLTGSVETIALKTKVAADVQQFFGNDVLINNQITVKAAEAPAEIAVPSPVTTEALPVANMTPPPAAKLYFRTASSSLPSKTNETIAPILDWLKAHPESKAVISGFHDSVGSPEMNMELAKKRALATLDALKAAGVDESRIVPRPPVSTDGGTDLAEARRVEVSIE